jgi:hypothetical protein
MQKLQIVNFKWKNQISKNKNLKLKMQNQTPKRFFLSLNPRWGSFEIMANVHHFVDESFFNLNS